jgi:hypothetical protein
MALFAELVAVIRGEDHERVAIQFELLQLREHLRKELVDAANLSDIECPEPSDVSFGEGPRSVGVIQQCTGHPLWISIEDWFVVGRDAVRELEGFARCRDIRRVDLIGVKNRKKRIDRASRSSQSMARLVVRFPWFLKALNPWAWPSSQ